MQQKSLWIKASAKCINNTKVNLKFEIKKSYEHSSFSIEHFTQVVKNNVN